MTQKTITIEQGEAYVHRVLELELHPTCPVCETNNVMWDIKSLMWRDDGELVIDVECLACLSKWKETYVLSAALPLEE